MKILYIAPLPPPAAGHSLVSQVLFDALLETEQVVLVDMKKEGLKDGALNWKRFYEVFSMLRKVWRMQSGTDAVYLTISESLAGNIKDLLIYMLCWRRLSTMYIHLHGGSIKRLLWDHYPLLFWWNRVMIKKMGGVIISGRSHLSIFEKIIDSNKIHIIPNFAKDEVFLSEEDILRKFASVNPVRILFLSNCIPQKGIYDLLDAFLKLPEPVSSRLRLDFAGRFVTEGERCAFLKKIEGVRGIVYHGVVNDQEKVALFHRAHAFCLPTRFLEGQPISILEAYAAGCVVITTGQSGILDIFTPLVNGYAIQPGSVGSICSALGNVVKDSTALEFIALGNHRLAKSKYRVHLYTKAVKAVITGETARKSRNSGGKVTTREGIEICQNCL